MFEEYKISWWHLVLILVVAFIVTLAVFARAPETVDATSPDGRVRLSGMAPRSLGPFKVVLELESSFESRVVPMTLIYGIEPDGVLLSSPLQLSFSYLPIQLGDRDPNKLTLASWNRTEKKWEMVESRVDTETRMVYADIHLLAPWTLLFKE